MRRLDRHKFPSTRDGRVIVSGVTAVLLALGLLLLGSGTLEWMHDLQHDREDARADRERVARGVPVETHHHDDENCPLHARLHATFVVSQAFVFVLSVAGLAVLRAVVPVLSLPRSLPEWRSCRGPPRLFV